MHVFSVAFLDQILLDLLDLLVFFFFFMDKHNKIPVKMFDGT